MAAKSEVAGLFDEFVSSHFGIANSFERTKEILCCFETLTTTSYTVWKQEKYFGEGKFSTCPAYTVIACGWLCRCTLGSLCVHDAWYTLVPLPNFQLPLGQ